MCLWVKVWRVPVSEGVENVPVSEGLKSVPVSEGVENEPVGGGVESVSVSNSQSASWSVRGWLLAVLYVLSI